MYDGNQLFLGERQVVGEIGDIDAEASGFDVADGGHGVGLVVQIEPPVGAAGGAFGWAEVTLHQVHMMNPHAVDGAQNRGHVVAMIHGFYGDSHLK